MYKVGEEVWVKYKVESVCSSGFGVKELGILYELKKESDADYDGGVYIREGDITSSPIKSLLRQNKNSAGYYTEYGTVDNSGKFIPLNTDLIAKIQAEISELEKYTYKGDIEATERSCLIEATKIETYKNVLKMLGGE